MLIFACVELHCLRRFTNHTHTRAPTTNRPAMFGNNIATVSFKLIGACHISVKCSVCTYALCVLLRLLNSSIRALPTDVKRLHWKGFFIFSVFVFRTLRSTRTGGRETLNEFIIRGIFLDTRGIDFLFTSSPSMQTMALSCAGCMGVWCARALAWIDAFKRIGTIAWLQSTSICS